MSVNENTSKTCIQPEKDQTTNNETDWKECQIICEEEYYGMKTIRTIEKTGAKYRIIGEIKNEGTKTDTRINNEPSRLWKN